VVEKVPVWMGVREAAAPSSHGDPGVFPRCAACVGVPLFGTNGVRGLVGKTMTSEIALRLGLATGTWLKPGDRVAVARDARDSGPMLEMAFCSGLNATGVHAVLLGTIPTPGAQLAVRDGRFAAGAVVTASHNPAEYNGIKLVAPDGTETSKEEEGAVERIFMSGAFRFADWAGVGATTRDEGAVERYVESVLRKVDARAIRAARLTAVLDPGGGAGCVSAPRLLAALGVKTVCLSCELDGAFSDRPSEPSPENAKRCIEAVRKHRANIGILQDGDADRAVFIDEHGAYVWGDTSLALMAKHELRRHGPGGVVCTAVSSSSCVADAVKAEGGRLEWTVVGSPIVAREMIRHKAVFGGEDNGGAIFTRHQVCRDGLMAMAFMLELIATTGKPLSALAAEIPRYALAKSKVELPDAKKASLIARLRDEVPREPGVREVDPRDGVKAYVDGGWALVRASGTEPIVRIQAEARTEAEAQALVDRFKGIVARLV
jgi:phosphomannomutase/phosphoglucomutase